MARAGCLRAVAAPPTIVIGHDRVLSVSEPRESDKPTDPEACDAEEFHYLGWSLGAKVGWGLAAHAADRLTSVALIAAEPENSGETSTAMIDLISEGGAEAVADAMSQMWDMPDWALEQQRRNDPRAVLAYFRSSWPDLSHVPDELSMPSLLMCGTDDEVQDPMARAARRGNAEFVGLDGEDHMATFLSVAARTAYRDFLAHVHGG